jgi:hypothetical protein
VEDARCQRRCGACALEHLQYNRLMRRGAANRARVALCLAVAVCQALQ